MRRIYLLAAIVAINFAILSNAFAQTTFISSIDRQSGSLNEVVTINGNGFGNNIGDLRVYFGGALGNIISASPTIIEVEIPANASFDHISVINLANNTHVTSSERFFLSYSGNDFDLNNIPSQFDNPTGERAVFDLCLCDFNQDGTSDIAVTSTVAESGQAGMVSIFTNNSLVGSVNLSLLNIPLDETLYTDCGDLNGDGLADLILSEGGSQNVRVYILQNTTVGGSISFNLAQVLLLPNQDNGDIRNIDRILMQDLDKDGRQDIIATNTIDNAIDIFQNNGTNNNISFNTTPIQIFTEEGFESSGLDSYDLNNDGFDEIIVTPAGGPNIYIFPNSSGVGNIEFDEFIRLDQAGILAAVKAGDLNNDSFADLVSVDGGNPGDPNNNANIFMNTTGTDGGEIQFTKVSDLVINGNPEDLDFGDLNGDGLLDVAITSILSGADAGISVLINTTVNNSISFDVMEIPTTSSTRNIRINDVDGDGRPDLAFTHDIAFGSLGDLSVLLNQNCIIPEITPEDNQLICSNNNLILQATQSNGTTYRWDLNINSAGFNTVQNGPLSSIDVQNFLNPNEVGEFRVTIISEGGNCQNTSSSVRITVDGTTSIDPILSSGNMNNEVCPGDDLVINVDNPPAGAVIYEWTGPNFETTTTTPQLIRPNFEPEFAGRYEMTINSGSCRSAAGFVIIGARNTPFIQIDDGGLNLICQGETRELSVPFFDGFGYQWRLNGVDLTGETGTTLTASNAGDYSLTITDETTCSFETPTLTLTNIQRPTAVIDVDPLICQNLSLEFTANSTGADGFAITNTWNFGDGNVATGDVVSNTYVTAGTFPATLTAEYINVPGCDNTVPASITVRDENTTVPITTPEGTEKCPSATLPLVLPTNFESYLWSTGDTGPTTVGATIPGESANTITVDWTDDAGCVGNSEIEITNFPNSELIIESDLLLEDDTVRLGENDQSVSLFINAGTDPIWEPAEVIENNLGTSVTVFPSEAFTTITLTATTSNDCRETKSVVVVNNFVVPRRTFSPNGDGQGFECWEILNARILQGCTVYIFDSKGLIVQETSSPFSDDNCIWDGTTNGRVVPEGVYYYVLKCDDTNFNDTGSILLAR